MPHNNLESMEVPWMGISWNHIGPGTVDYQTQLQLFLATWFLLPITSPYRVFSCSTVYVAGATSTSTDQHSTAQRAEGNQKKKF